MIIPTRNRREFLPAAIESVRRQSHERREIIVIDDGSHDGTSDWIEEEHPDLRLLRLPRPLGAAAARNRGIQIATGELAAFLDSDDRWEPDFLAAHVRTLGAAPQAALSFCDCRITRSDGSPMIFRSPPFSPGQDLILYQLQDTLIHSMSSVVVRRDAFVRCGGLNENLRICHDRELYLRLLLEGGFRHIPRPLALKSEHGGNLTSDHRLWKDECLLLLDIFFRDPRSEPYRPLRPQLAKRWRLKLARIAFGRRDPSFALRMMLEACLRPRP